MPQPTIPTKQLVRDYLDERTRSDDPPPERDEIRRQMGWFMVPENQRPDRDERD
jgi:hypothetical protein